MHLHVGVAQVREHALSVAGQLRDAFHGDDVGGESREERGLVAGARADLQHLLVAA